MTNLIVKEPEELVMMKGDFSESALKLAAYLIAILEKDKIIYEINVKDYLEKFDKKVGDYNYLYSVAKELSQKQFEMNDRFNKTFSIFNFISSVNYAYGILKVEFSNILLNYLLEVKEKYLKYNIKNIMSLSSKYSIRLYKILKDSLELNKRFSNWYEKKLKIEELREILEIPRSYQYSAGIKKRILEKAKKEFEQHTDIIFDYEEIKTGRKVTHLKFVIRKNPTKTEEYRESKINYNLKSVRHFISFLRKNYIDKCFGYTLIAGNVCWLKINDKGLVYGVLDSGEKKIFNSSDSERLYNNWWEVAKANWFYQKVILEDMRDFREVHIADLDFRLNLNQTIEYLKEENLLK